MKEVHPSIPRFKSNSRETYTVFDMGVQIYPDSMTLDDDDGGWNVAVQNLREEIHLDAEGEVDHDSSLFFDETLCMPFDSLEAALAGVPDIIENQLADHEQNLAEAETFVDPRPAMYARKSAVEAKLSEMYPDKTSFTFSEYFAASDAVEEDAVERLNAS